MREPKSSGCIFRLPTISRWPTKPQCRQAKTRPRGFRCLPHDGHVLLVPRSLPGQPKVAQARHVGLCRFLLQVVDIFAIFPAGHALVVMPSCIPAADAMGIADEDRLDRKSTRLNSSHIPLSRM